MQSNQFPEKLAAYCRALAMEFDEIPPQRRNILEKLSEYVVHKRQTGDPVRIIVICTHNSRRSHIGQLWLQAAAAWYGIGEVQTFSGGTEATAFNFRSVAALREAGFPLEQISEGKNPRYRLMLPGSEGVMLFSKKFDEAPNPRMTFAAVMVCTDADEGCPFVPGADGRFSIPYEDPKHFDETPLEASAYDERVRQIGREMFYVMQHANKQLSSSN